VGCEYSDLQFAAPKIVPPVRYDSIYDNADRLPGYDRYCHYLKLTQFAAKPLDELAAHEAAYWFIRSELARLSSAVRVLDICGGLGYLTYAIHAAATTSLRSTSPTTRSRRRRSTFGELYLHKDLDVLAEEQPSSFDVMIMIEIIEHVADPKGFLGAAASVLKKNGQIMLTAPNKSDFPLGTCWKTENPPVNPS
jgi:2-polyprenyl-3-methyl-5-hydroxy-6-metoxy-1,4-benzoquinol methylase